MQSTAPSPFTDNDADLILRSSDNVDFYVHRLLLSLVSPFFRAMFALPQSPGDVKKDTNKAIPIVPVAENQRILEGLLVWIDPRCNPIFRTLDDAGDILQAAEKYDMSSVIIRMGSALADAKHIEGEPLRVFAIAYRHRELDGMKKLVQLAARQTLKLTVPFQKPPINELRNISGDAVHHLYEYHARCGKVASAVADPDTRRSLYYEWITDVNGAPWVDCAGDCCRGLTKSMRRTVNKEWGTSMVNVSLWWLDYMRVATYALRSRPAGTTILVVDAAGILLRAQNCSKAPLLYPYLAKFHANFAAAVEKAVDQVEFKIL